MKDGRTHLAHKAEHAVDLETGAVVGITVQDADAGDTKTMVETLITAAEQVEAVLPAVTGLTEVVGDKGYPSNETLVALAELGIRSYVSEPDRGRRRWRGKPAARAAPAAAAWGTPRASPLVALSGSDRPFDPRDSSWIAPATQRHQLVPLTLQGSRSATAC